MDSEDANVTYLKVKRLAEYGKEMAKRLRRHLVEMKDSAFGNKILLTVTYSFYAKRHFI